MKNIFSNQAHLMRGMRIFISALMLISIMLSTMPVQLVLAALYTDTFNSGPGSSVSSFTTGTAATGLSYICSGGAGCDFQFDGASGEGGSGAIDVLSTDTDGGTTEKITVVALSTCCHNL